MPISFTCACGKAGKVKDEYAGRKIRCPECRTVFAVPAAEGARDIEDEALSLLLADSPAEKSPPRPEPREEATQPVPTRPPARKPIEPTPPRTPPRPQPAPKPARKERSPGVAFEPGWFGSVNSGVIGGLLMMLIAVIWFVVGMAAGRIFLYTPILFVIGFGSMIKGFFNRE